MLPDKMKQYRVTKYEPQKRNERGEYLVDDWMSICDVGKEFNGGKLTRIEYDRIECAYIDIAVQMLTKAGVQSLVLKGVENYSGFSQEDLGIRDGQEIKVTQLGPYMRAIVQERFWGRLEGEGAFLHFGYDFYMYVGVPAACPDSLVAAARKRGIFVESFTSPYN